MQLDVIETSDSLTRLALSGRLDTEGAGAIETTFNALTVARGKPALVDISGVTFLASMGIRVLVTAAKALHRHRLKLVLVAPQPLVADVIRTAAIDTLVDVAEDEPHALALLADAP